MNASRSVVRSSVMTLIGQAIRMIVQLVGLVLLSRLLLPSEFGTFAVIMAVVAFGELFRDFGILNAAIRVKQLTQQQLSNLFWVTTSLGILLFVMSLCLRLIGNHTVPAELPLTSVVFILNGLQVSQQVILVRQGRFGVLTVTDSAAQIVALGVAVVAALGGLGIWALIFQLLTAAFIVLITRQMTTRWLPQFPSNLQSIKPLLGFGANVGAAQFLGYLANNAAILALNHFSGPASTGYYARAYQLFTVPVNQFLSPLTNVLLPRLSAATTSPARFTAALNRVQIAVYLPCASVLALLAGQSKLLASTVLGDRWIAAAETLSILAIGGIFQVASFLTFWAFLSYGLGTQLLYYNLISKPLVAGLTVLGATFSIEHTALGYALGLVVSYPLSYFMLNKALGFSLRICFLASIRQVLAALLATAAVYFSTTFNPVLPSLIALGLSFAIGAIVFLLVLMMNREDCRTLVLVTRSFRKVNGL